MQTVILKPYDKKISGVVEYSLSDLGVRINCSIKGLGGGIHKLFLMSSLKPENEPVIADTAEPKCEAAFISGQVSASELAYRGYYPRDIDTFVLALKRNDGYLVKAAGFERLWWDVDLSLRRISPCPLPKAVYQTAPDDTTEREDLYMDVMAEIADFCANATPSAETPLDGMSWYMIPGGTMPARISSYEHILTPKALAMISADGFPLLFGTKKEGLTAFAHKSFCSNPFENADDCTVKIGDYYIVGIRLAKNGQYFERLIY